MTGLKKEVESQLKVRFSDCDPFNHLNNSRYIDYMIMAREDQLLAEYQFDPYQLALERGIGWVSAQTQISYLQPALLMEVVTIQTRLLSVTGKSLLVEALMWNAGKTVLKAVMWAKLVHYNIREGKSHSHSEDLMEFLNQIVAPLPDEPDFEARVAQLRSRLKPAS